MKRLQMATFVAVMVLARVAGADDCKQTESKKDCFVRLYRAVPEEAKQQAAEQPKSQTTEQQKSQTARAMSQTRTRQLQEDATRAGLNEKLALENTGGQSLAPGESGSTKDFASDLISMLESSGVGSRVGDTVTVHLGFPRSAPADKKKVNLSVALKDSKLDPAVAGLLTGQDLDKAQRSIDQSSRDLTFGVAWAFKERSLERFQTKATEFSEKNRAVSDAMFPVSDADAMLPKGTLQLMVARVVDAQETAFMEHRAEAFDENNVSSEVTRAQADARRLFATWVDRSVEMVSRVNADAADEQPQIWGEALYHYRDVLIGPKEVKVSLNYERGAPGKATEQLNALLSSSESESKVATFVKESEQGVTATSKPSFTFKGEYNQVQSRTFSLPVLSAKLNKPSTHVLSLSAVAGWKIPTLSNDRDAKLDFNGTFENDSSDPKKKNRLIASLKFTQKLSDKYTLPLTLVYASHTNDLDVNRRFSAHFGISYKMGSDSAKTKKAELMAALAAERSQSSN